MLLTDEREVFPRNGRCIFRTPKLLSIVAWASLYASSWGLLGFKTGVNKYFFKGYALSPSNNPLFMPPLSNKSHSVEFVHTKASCDEPGLLATKLVNFKLASQTAITFIEWKNFRLTKRCSSSFGAFIGMWVPSMAPMTLGNWICGKSPVWCHLCFCHRVEILHNLGLKLQVLIIQYLQFLTH